MPHPNGQLTAEEIEPTEEDTKLAKELIDQGFKQVSSKYRMLRRFKETPAQPPPACFLLDLAQIPKEMRGDLIVRTDETLKSLYFKSLRCAKQSDVLEVTLTVKQFRAFKLLGGQASWG